MFTGLIEDVGFVREWHSKQGYAKIGVETTIPLGELSYGESIAVNGVCLTVEEIIAAQGIIRCHVLQETRERTGLAELRTGNVVNMERAMSAQGRFGGHFVTGHVDTTSRIHKIEQAGGDWKFYVRLPAAIAPLVVHKGSIAVDGISLTIATLSEDDFSFHVTPYTREHTNLRHIKQEHCVNLEADIVGKYVLRQRQAASPAGGITSRDLYDAGFG